MRYRTSVGRIAHFKSAYRLAFRTSHRLDRSLVRGEDHCPKRIEGTETALLVATELPDVAAKGRYRLRMSVRFRAILQLRVRTLSAWADHGRANELDS